MFIAGRRVVCRGRAWIASWCGCGDLVLVPG
jgi:hypothetical protein